MQIFVKLDIRQLIQGLPSWARVCRLRQAPSFPLWAAPAQSVAAVLSESRRRSLVAAPSFACACACVVAPSTPRLVATPSATLNPTRHLNSRRHFSQIPFRCSAVRVAAQGVLRDRMVAKAVGLAWANESVIKATELEKPWISLRVSGRCWNRVAGSCAA